MSDQVTVLGGGHGTACTVRALRDDVDDLTAIVTTGDDGGSSGVLRRCVGGPAVGDLRRTLLALGGDESPLARALARRLIVRPVGRHPLGNLVIRSIADAFDDLEAASDWLAEQLGASGRVLPATVDPVSLVAEAEGALIEGESAIGTSGAALRRLRFSPPRPRVSLRVYEAIADADWVLLAPGSLFTSVLAVCALPDVVSALSETSAPVAWICNLAPQPGETEGMSALDHLRALRRHGVRVDVVIFDPEAELHLTPGELAGMRLEAIARPLRSEQPEQHAPDLLRAALHELFASRSRPAVKLAV